MSQTEAPKVKFYDWKKNLDNRFIAGEDLQAERNGLKKEMIVIIENFGEDETFDTNTQKKKPVTDLFMKELNGAKLYKPAVLNRTNARFFAAEFKSDNVYDWLNKPVVMFAQADRRHGYVVRFRSAPAQVAFDNKAGIAKLNESKTKEELTTNWAAIPPESQADAETRAVAKNLGDNFALVALYASKKEKIKISDQRNYERIINEKEVESYAKIKAELEAIK